MPAIEQEIAEWRSFVERRPAVGERDLDELEDHLRDQIADLSAAGLADDEAFLVAVKRMGRLDSLSREFAREHSGRLWRQFVLAPDEDPPTADRRWPVALAFAVVAAVVAVVVQLAATTSDEEPEWPIRNLSLFVLPILAAWFAVTRRLTLREWLIGALPFAAGALVVNLYPFADEATTMVLAAAHLPVVLWFAVAVPYCGGTLGAQEQRMDFVRFTGEWVIYYTLLAIGGGVLLGMTALVLDPAMDDPGTVIEWLVAPGAAGAVLVAAWLVESKQRVIENMAPVLTMVFTPLFAMMLTVAAVVYAVTAAGSTFDRELLGVFDALMVVVLGLVLYGLSARDPLQPPGWADRIQLVAVVAALVLDVMVLGSMLVRIGDLGLTPNRVAALGLNLVLLVNLAGTALLATAFLTGRRTFHQLERWQTAYLPVFALWAATVVVVLPPAFGFE